MLDVGDVLMFYQGIAHMKGVGGLDGWRWIFILVSRIISSC